MNIIWLAFIFMILILLYFISKPICFSLLLPLRAITDQMTNIIIIKIGNFILNPGDILGIFTIIMCLLFFFSNYSLLFSTKKFSLNTITFMVLILLFWYLITSILSDPIFFNLENWAKMASWLMILPIAGTIFNDIKKITIFRKIFLISLLIILISAIIANIFKIGNIAYSWEGYKRGFHLGFFASESALSLSLVAAIPLILIPHQKKNKIIFHPKILGIILLFITFIFLLFIFLRTGIIAALIGLIIYYFLLIKSKLNLPHINKIFIILISLLVIISLYSITHQEQIKKRFKDFSEFSKEKSIEKLGSGRIWLLKKYYEEWNSRGILYKFFGIDTGVLGGQKKIYKIKVGTHNDILTLLLSCGVIGVIFYLILLTYIFLILYKKFKKNIDCLSQYLSIVGLSAIAIYIILVFHGSIYQILPMSYLAFILGISISYSKENQYEGAYY